MSGEKQKPEQQPAVEADEPKTPGEAEAAPSQEAPAPAKGSKSHLWALLLILVVVAGMAGLTYRYAIQHPGTFETSQQNEPAAPPASIEHPAPTTAPAASTPEPAPNADVIKAAPIIPPKPAMPLVQTRLNSQEAKQLMAAMEQLQQQLQRLSTDNAQLQQALAQQQHIDLRTRLKLIADPDTRLKQLSLLWEDVSLSPVLSADQRNEAVSMTAAAQEALAQNLLWQQRLDRWIAQLAGPEAGPDLIPHFAHPWLAWLANQFHLRPAPTNDNGGSQVLREKLMQIRRGMAIESWPESKDWQPIRAELILIQASSAKNGAEKDAGIGLPNDFTTMRQAVATLHETARRWLEGKP
ncbi:MAG TPA: hypothetical protein VNH42_02500 [Mariprofundaceae bacterium]|nr:hypothetical protein [Mariprofundaceae bacterium]